MKQSKLSEQYIRSLKQNIVNLLDDYQLDQYHGHIFDIVIADLLLTGSELLNVFENGIQNCEGESKIIDVLADRWSRIASSPICYSHNSELPMNLLCISLANELCAKSEDITAMLMPTVFPHDCYHTELHTLDCGKYMIVNDAKNFIDLDTFVDLLFDKVQHNEASLFEIYNMRYDTIVPLDEEEQNRLSLFSPSLFRALNTVRSLFKKQPVEFYGVLCNLRNSLRLSSSISSHRYSDLNPDIPINIAIAKFFEYWDTLSQEQKMIYRNLPDGGKPLEEVLLQHIEPEAIERRMRRGVVTSIDLVVDELDQFLASAEVKVALNVEVNLNPSVIAQLKAKVKDELNRNVILIGKDNFMSSTQSFFDLSKLPKMNFERELQRQLPNTGLSEYDNMFIELGVIVSQFFEELPRNSKLFNKCINFFIAINREAGRFVRLSDQEKSDQIREAFLRAHCVYHFFSDFTTLAFFSRSRFSSELNDFAKKYREFLSSSCQLEINDAGTPKIASAVRKAVKNRLADRVISSLELHAHQGDKRHQLN